MSDARQYGLTGLEQYSLEKAGYFVRRGVVDSKVISAARMGVEELAALGGSESPRRYEISETATSVVETTEITGLASDLFPASEKRVVVCLPNSNMPETARSTDWGRGYPLFVYSTEADLAAVYHGRDAAYMIEVPLQAYHRLILVPGSHTQPLSRDQLSTLEADPKCDLPEAVRVRLAAGDVVVYSSSLLSRCESASPGDACVRLTVRRKV